MLLNPSLCFPPIDGWDKFSHPYAKKEFGKWELILPPKYDKSPAVDHNTKLKVENKTSSYLFSRPQKVSLCHGGARTCHCDAPGRFPAMCDEPSEKLACCCQQHAALTAWVGRVIVRTQSAQWRLDTPEEPSWWILYQLLSTADIPQDIVQSPARGVNGWLVFSSGK